MRLSSFILMALLTLSSGAFAQEAISAAPGSETKQFVATAAKLSLGESLIIAPNPLPKANPKLTITAVNVEIFSYIIVSSTGQIVELENLSGRPDPTIIDLTGQVTLGTYIIRFDTDSGTISRKFTVI